MRVAVVAHSPFPLAPPFAGGLESFTWHLCRGLRARGVRVVLFAHPASDPRVCHELVSFPPVELSDRARRDVNMPAEEVVQNAFVYLQVMEALAQRSDVDVIHNNSLHYLPVALAGLAQAPMVTSLHTPPTPWLEPALRLAGDRAHTVAVSHAVACWWDGITSPRVIHNGVDMNVWVPGPGGEELVWYGRIVPEKAPHLAIRIAREAGRRLRLAGPVGDRGYFDGQVRPLLGDGATYVGHLGPDELVELVGSSLACLVTPVWDEPFGLVAAEAMATGTPVLALERGGLPEIVSVVSGRIVPAGDDAEQTVVRATELLDEVAALPRADVRRHVEQHFNLEGVISDYLALYEELT